MTRRSNQSVLLRGAAAILEGHKQTEKGNALLTVGMVQIWDSPITATRKDDTAFTFSLSRFEALSYDEKGVEIRGDKSAMLTAFCVTHLGCDADQPIPSAIKVAFNRAYGAAVLIVRDKLPIKADSNNNLSHVPLSLVTPLYDAENKRTPAMERMLKNMKKTAESEGKRFNEGKAIDQLRKAHVSCTGKQHHVYGKLPSNAELLSTLKGIAAEKDYIRKPSERKARPVVIDAKNWSARMRSTIALVKSLTASADEGSDKALTVEQRKQLAELGEAIAAYFVADPLGDD